jgi:hypothetical protein
LTAQHWWAAEPNERYWLEITDRLDLGTDLNAPQQNDQGRAYWGYSLINEIERGDVVFHYHKTRHGIVAVSRAATHAWDDQVVWRAHGTTARGSGVKPYPRPGWRLGLDAFVELQSPVTLSIIRGREAQLRAVRDALVAGRPSESLYFPFEISDKRPPRATQAYLTKFPADLMPVFPELQQAVDIAAVAAATTAKALGGKYRTPDEDAAVSQRRPLYVDPSKLERAMKGHATTQNALANYLGEHGIEPRSPIAGEPNYDLAWEVGGTCYVTEVKTLPADTEEDQLRIGLGQVLRYRQRLALLRSDHVIRAVMVTERRPADSTWQELCEEHGVQLLWPGCFSRLPLPASRMARSKPEAIDSDKTLYRGEVDGAG